MFTGEYQQEGGMRRLSLANIGDSVASQCGTLKSAHPL